MGASDLTIHNKWHQISRSRSLPPQSLHDTHTKRATLAHFPEEIDGGGGENWQAAGNTDNLPLFILS